MTVLENGEQEVVGYWSSYVDDNGLVHHFIKPPLLLVRRECARNSLTKFFSLLNPIKFWRDDRGQRNKFQGLKLPGFNKFSLSLFVRDFEKTLRHQYVACLSVWVNWSKSHHWKVHPRDSKRRRCLKKKNRDRLLLLIGGRGRGDGVGKLKCPRDVTTPKCTLR